MEIKNSWMGTPAEVSQLPEPVRQYVRKLEVENAELRAYKEAAENQSMAWLANALEQYTKGDVITVPAGAGTEEEFFAWLKNQAKNSGAVPAERPPRITEQDVREILEAYWDSHDDCGDWLKSVDGRDLLNKLNADRQVPEVAVTDGLVEALVQSQYQVDVDGTFIGVSRQALDEAIEIIRSPSAPSHRQQSAAILDEAIDVLTELMDLMQGVIEGEYKPDSLTLQPARIFMNKLKFGDRCPSHESEQGSST